MEPPARVIQRNLIRALARGDLAEAALLLQRLESLAPLAVPTRVLRLEYLVRTRSADAAPLAAQLVRDHPTSARAFFWAGRAAYDRRDHAEAARLFAECRRHARRWLFDRWLGKALTQRGELEAAEALLAPLVERHPVVEQDLAWLYERMGEPERALILVERVLARDPGAPLAGAQRLRLRAEALEPAELVVELEELAALGEPIELEMLPTYLRGLLLLGRGGAARALVADRLATLTPKVAAQMGWQAHRLGAFDLSYDLLAAGLPANLDYGKHLSALERAAKMAGRVDDLRRLYAAHAPRAPKLRGRAQKLPGGSIGA